MKLRKKADIKDTSHFEDADLFQTEQDENEKSENEDAEDENSDEENKPQQHHQLDWRTSTNLYDSAIMVKEISFVF